MEKVKPSKIYRSLSL